jgi:hypothetical protein
MTRDAKTRQEEVIALDARWAVAEWRVPGQVVRPSVVGAPVWWHGAEDASQSFFQAMGIRPT